MITGKKIGILIPVIFLLSLPFVYSIDVTETTAEVFLRGEYNRGFNNYGEASAAAGIEFNKLVKLRGGFSMGTTAEDTDINAFFSAGYSPFSAIPLTFSLMYIYSGFPEYSAHTHAILPVISFGTDRAGVSAGVNFRLASFYGSEAQFESIFSFNGYFNFINNELLRIGISAGNYSEFLARNMGAYSFCFNVLVRFNDNWSMNNSLEFLQSGGDGFSTVFYGFAWRGGVKFTW